MVRRMEVTMPRYDKHTFLAPCGVRFVVTLGRSTYSVAAYDRSGRRIAWSGRNWGPSLTDALASAVWNADPKRASGGMSYLFKRIDGYTDGPSVIDLWNASKLEAA